MFKNNYSVRTNLQKLFMQRYERYLPTAFDESMSILEKMNKLIEAQNALIDVVNSHVDFTSEQLERAFGIIDDNLANQLEVFSQELEEQKTLYEEIRDTIHSDLLPDSVRQKLEEWLLNGTVEELINETIFGEINTKLETLQNISENMKKNVVDFCAVGEDGNDDTDGIKDAFNYAVENNQRVYADKDFIVSENIDGFMGTDRTIKNPLIGDGSITRGEDTFYFSPKGSETNTLYVSDDNHYLNDGITRDKPIAMSTAMNYLQSMKDATLDGHWVIKIIGHYNSRGIQRVKLPFFKNMLVITGERDSSGDITTTVDGDGVTDNYFIRFDTGGSGQKFLHVKDIIFRNWKNHSSSAGVMSVWDNIDLLVEDCEAYDCSQFLWARNGRLRAYRNKIRDGHTGISAQYHTSFNMDNNDIKGFSRAGIHIGRNSAGRVSANIFEDNYINIDCAQSSRLSTLENTHKNWLFRGINLYNNATWENGLNEIIEYDNPPEIPFYETFYGSAYNVIRSGLGLVKHYTQIPDQLFPITTREQFHMNEYFGSFLRTQDFSLRRGNMHIQIKLLVHSSAVEGDNSREFDIKLSTSENPENAYLVIPIKTTASIVGEVEINLYFREKSTTAYSLTKVPEADGVRTQYKTFAHGQQFRGGNRLRAQSMYIDSIKGDFNVFGVLTYISQ